MNPSPDFVKRKRTGKHPARQDHVCTQARSVAQFPVLRYSPVMKYLIAYSSQTGNTRALAERMRTVLPAEDCLFFGECTSVPAAAVRDAEIVFAGFWVYRGSCDPVSAEFLQALRKKTVALFGTAGFGGSEVYFQRILTAVGQLVHKSCTLEKPFVCMGKIAPDVLQRYQAELKRDPENERVLRLIENYKAAKTHPDQQDFQALAAWVEAALVNHSA